MTIKIEDNISDIVAISGETFPKGIWDMRIKFDVLDAIKKLNPEYILCLKPRWYRKWACRCAEIQHKIIIHCKSNW